MPLDKFKITRKSSTEPRKSSSTDDNDDVADVTSNQEFIALWCYINCLMTRIQYIHVEDAVNMVHCYRESLPINPMGKHNGIMSSDADDDDDDNDDDDDDDDDDTSESDSSEEAINPHDLMSTKEYCFSFRFTNKNGIRHELRQYQKYNARINLYILYQFMCSEVLIKIIFANFCISDNDAIFLLRANIPIYCKIHINNISLACKPVMVVDDSDKPCKCTNYFMQLRHNDISFTYINYTAHEDIYHYFDNPHIIKITFNGTFHLMEHQSKLLTEARKQSASVMRSMEGHHFNLTNITDVTIHLRVATNLNSLMQCKNMKSLTLYVYKKCLFGHDYLHLASLKHLNILHDTESMEVDDLEFCASCIRVFPIMLLTSIKCAVDITHTFNLKNAISMLYDETRVMSHHLQHVHLVVTNSIAAAAATTSNSTPLDLIFHMKSPKVFIILHSFEWLLLLNTMCINTLPNIKNVYVTFNFMCSDTTQTKILLTSIVMTWFPMVIRLFLKFYDLMHVCMAIADTTPLPPPPPPSSSVANETVMLNQKLLESLYVINKKRLCIHQEKILYSWLYKTLRFFNIFMVCRDKERFCDCCKTIDFDVFLIHHYLDI